MALPKLDLIVPEESYTATFGDGIFRAEVASGASRQRLDQIGAPWIVDIALYLDPEDYAYFGSFWRGAIGNGALSFLIDLRLDDSGMREYTAKFIKGSASMSPRGPNGIVQGQLEVKQIRPNTEFDEAVVMLRRLYGNRSDIVLNKLAILVNEDLDVYQ